MSFWDCHGRIGEERKEKGKNAEMDLKYKFNSTMIENLCLDFAIYRSSEFSIPRCQQNVLNFQLGDWCVRTTSKLFARFWATAKYFKINWQNQTSFDPIGLNRSKRPNRRTVAFWFVENRLSCPIDGCLLLLIWTEYLFVISYDTILNNRMIHFKTNW